MREMTVARRRAVAARHGGERAGGIVGGVRR